MYFSQAHHLKFYYYNICFGFEFMNYIYVFFNFKLKFEQVQTKNLTPLTLAKSGGLNESVFEDSVNYIIDR